MQKCHIKKGDVVVVIAGTEKGKRGKVIEVLPKKQRVLVEGVKMIKKHMRKSQLHPQGAIIEREGTIHISNVMLAEEYDARRAKRATAQQTTQTAK
ncbi:MAG: 50S ribosomal protein L24 [Verrucomicrobiia bacterium]|jgi:large subunit ribosomal protein L24